MGVKSFTFVQLAVSKNFVSVSDTSAFVNLIVLIVFVSLFSELCDLFYGCGPEGEDSRQSIIVQTSGCSKRCVISEISVSTLAVKILAKATAILVPVAVPCICT